MEKRQTIRVRVNISELNLILLRRVQPRRLIGLVKILVHRQGPDLIVQRKPSNQQTTYTGQEQLHLHSMHLCAKYFLTPIIGPIYELLKE
jgi:hypothetical protein